MGIGQDQMFYMRNIFILNSKVLDYDYLRV